VNSAAEFAGLLVDTGTAKHVALDDRQKFVANSTFLSSGFLRW
jgi:hypothetical protein